jgi:hypothetical protein
MGKSTLAAVVEPQIALGEIEADDRQLIQAVLAHDRVIQALFQQTPVLPLRFGTCFQNRDALLNHLDQHYSHYCQQLQWFQGKAEYTLKCQPRELEVPSIQPKPLIPESTPESIPESRSAKGRNYFLAKKQQFLDQSDRQARQTQELQWVIKAIQRSYPDAVHPPSETPEERLYLLVGHRRLSHLQKQLSQWQTQAPSWELQLSEPLPPYHFVQPPRDSPS